MDGGGNEETARRRGASNRNPDVSKDRPKPQQGGTKTGGGGPFSGRFNPRLQKRPDRTADHTALPHQTWARVVLGASVLLIIYFSSGTPKTTHMAKQSEPLEFKRHQAFLCAPAFKKEIEDLGNKECCPAKCGRAVMDGLVTDEETDFLLALAKKGLSRGGGSGGASILDLHSGALSKGEGFVNIFKLEPDLFRPSDFEIYRQVKGRVKSAIAEHFGIPASSLHLTHPTFFSRLDSKPAVTEHDEYWHVHVDKTTYPSFHFTSLLYLADFGSDFEGGEFIFVDDKLNRTIEPRHGRISFFTSGMENKHHVKPVTKGSRFALTMGFTCDQRQAIPEPGSEGHQAFQKS